MEKIDLKNEFITYHLNRNHSPRTLEVYEKILKKFLARVDPLRCTIRDLYAYDTDQTHLAPNSRNLIIACLKSFFRWLKRMEYRSDNPAENLENVKLQKKIPKAITEKDLKLILSKAHPRNKTMLVLLFYYGLRQFELFSLKLQDFTKEEEIYCLNLCGKGNKERTIELSDEHSEVLRLYLQSYRPFIVAGDYLFVTRKGNPFSLDTFRSIWKTLMKKTGLDYTPHALRHGCVSHYINKGIDSLIVQKMVGHENSKMTSHYLHLPRGGLKEIVEKK